MEHELCWLWLTSRLGGAHAKIKSLVEFFGSVEEIYRSKRFHNTRLSSDEISLLMNKDLSGVKKICDELARIDGKIVIIDSEAYPRILKEAHNPPPVLYCKGKIPSLDDVLTIGVVGTRRTSEYGRLVTKRICANLAKAGAVTVSGMADGIDAIGAWATIEEGGLAVGVIGSGIDIAYPPENADLYEAITEKGCIITEFPPGTPPAKKNFPIRNRIIAGLSRGVLVTEAPEKSGALITARLAMEEGRDVFAVPRNISDIKYNGTNILIQQGAKLVMHPNDILCEYPYAKKIEPQKSAAKPEKAVKPVNPHNDGGERLKSLSEKEREIVELLIKGDRQIDELSRELKAPVGELNTRLIMLEMKGIVTKLPGSMYKLKID